MKNKTQGELVFLDEFRSQREQEQMEWSKIIPQEAYEVLEISDEEMDDFQYEYLTTSDLETLTMPEISWIIRHLMSRSDFEWRKEEAEKMINEILEDREKEDT
tara:strand:- start:540 stop:848 length:309 start_codon:yes stop_codon:yes gene_type:complete